MFRALNFDFLNCYFYYLLDTLSSGSESLEDFDNGGTLLHGDNTHLILLVDPDEEVLSLIVEDTLNKQINFYARLSPKTSRVKQNKLTHHERRASGVRIRRKGEE